MDGMGKTIAWPDTVGAKHFSPCSQPDTTHGPVLTPTIRMAPFSPLPKTLSEPGFP
jgi:hypothetical protein